MVTTRFESQAPSPAPPLAPTGSNAADLVTATIDKSQLINHLTRTIHEIQRAMQEQNAQNQQVCVEVLQPQVFHEVPRPILRVHAA